MQLVFVNPPSSSHVYLSRVSVKSPLTMPVPLGKWRRLTFFQVTFCLSINTSAFHRNEIWAGPLGRKERPLGGQSFAKKLGDLIADGGKQI